MTGILFLLFLHSLLNKPETPVQTFSPLSLIISCGLTGKEEVAPSKIPTRFSKCDVLDFSLKMVMIHGFLIKKAAGHS